jgi:hypothetical protein
MGEVIFNTADFLLQVSYVLVGLDRVKAGNTFDDDLVKVNDILLRNLPYKKGFIGLQAFVDGLDDGFPGLAFFYITIKSEKDCLLFSFLDWIVRCSLI